MSENRFAVLETSEDDDRRPYSKVVNRRAKRRRNQSQQIVSSQPQQQQQPLHQLLSSSSSRQQPRQQPAGQQSQSAARPSQQHQQQRCRRLARLFTGKAVATDRGKRGKRDRLGAAGKLINKVVFCIDNVDPSYDANNVSAFVAGLSVTVFTCFPAESRRQRNDPPGSITNRKAFRLCIDDADRAALHNEDAWPESVTISTWYYKPPNRQRPAAAAGTTSATTPITASTKTVPVPTGATAAVSVTTVDDD